MAVYRLIAADAHIVEPPDLCNNSSIAPQFHDRVLCLERRPILAGSEYDAW